MLSAGTEAGYIVRLADLVQWLKASRKLPLKAAVQAVAEKLEKQGAKLPIFRAQPDDYAQPTTKDNVLGVGESRLIKKAQIVMKKPPKLREDSFGGQLLANIQAVPVYCPEVWSDPPTPPGPEPAAVKVAHYILENWPRTWLARPPGAAPEPRLFMGSPGDKAAALCVPLSDARALWGFGTTAQVTPNIATFADLCAYRKTNKGAKWEPKHIELADAEVQARGGNGAPRVTAGVAAELGIKPERLNKIFAKWKRTERSPGRGKGTNAFNGWRYGKD